MQRLCVINKDIMIRAHQARLSRRSFRRTLSTTAVGKSKTYPQRLWLAQLLLTARFKDRFIKGVILCNLAVLPWINRYNKNERIDLCGKE